MLPDEEKGRERERERREIEGKKENAIGSENVESSRKFNGWRKCFGAMRVRAELLRKCFSNW